MKRRNLYAILIFFGFLVALVASFFVLFSVNKVNATYNAKIESDVSSLQEYLNRYKGKNLIFLSEKDIVLSETDFPYYYIDKIEKSFPNVLNVSILERRSAFCLKIGDEYLLLSTDGVVLEKSEESFSNREIIDINFEGIDVDLCSVGKKINTDNNELVFTVLQMAESIDLSDCIKEIKIIFAPEQEDALFITHTGVEIEVAKVVDKGFEKISCAYETYNELTDDHQKIFNKIYVYKNLDEEVKVVWSEN